MTSNQGFTQWGHFLESRKRIALMYNTASISLQLENHPIVAAFPWPPKLNGLDDKKGCCCCCCFAICQVQRTALKSTECKTAIYYLAEAKFEDAVSDGGLLGLTDYGQIFEVHITCIPLHSGQFVGSQNVYEFKGLTFFSFILGRVALVTFGLPYSCFCCPCPNEVFLCLLLPPCVVSFRPHTPMDKLCLNLSAFPQLFREGAVVSFLRFLSRKDIKSYFQVISERSLPLIALTVVRFWL